MFGRLVHVVVEDCPAFILREQLRQPVADMFPMAFYQAAPALPPWLDPQPVLGNGHSFFYRHSDPIEIFVSRSGPTTQITW